MRTAPWRPKIGRIASLTLGSVLVLASLPGQAAIFSDDEARRAIIDLRGRLEVQGRESNRRIDELTAQLERSTRGQLELQNQIESLRQEIASLRGQLEVQTNELVQTQRKQRDLYSDFDGRFKRLEPVQVQIDGRQVSVDPEERRQHDAGLAQFRAGDFSGAIATFQQFRSRWPASPYMSAVLFWIGSAQYATKDYKSAVTTFESLLAAFPDNPRAADALLSVGFSQVEGGDRKTGRKTLETVGTRYPGTQAAQLARERLSTLK
ncbi:MAG: hypothetical protein RIS35_1832 [Pseudomonadota bacterium]|jgi:tol-pal system protein YbgF